MTSAFIRLNKVPEHKTRDLTPLNNLCVNQYNDVEDLANLSFSHCIRSDSPNRKIRKKVNSYSLGKSINSNLHSRIEKIASSSNKTIPKRNQYSGIHRNISSGMRKLFISTSRSKNKKKNQRKKIPFKQSKAHQDTLLTAYNLNLYTHKSNETLNTNQSINIVSSKMLTQNTTHSNNNQSLILNDTQREKLNDIKQSITDLLLICNNKNGIIAELGLFLQLNAHDMSRNVNKLHHYSTEDGWNKSRARSQQCWNQKDSENLLSKIDNIDKKYEMMKEENSKLKSLINEKTGSFEDVKNSIKSVKEEINKLKKKNCNKQQSKQQQTIEQNTGSNMQNTQIKLINKAKLPMKNVSINLQLIQKVSNGGEGFKFHSSNNKDKETKDKDNKEKDKQTIISLQGTNENASDKIGALNFSKITKEVVDFNDEFMKNYDDFSPSWRRDADKMNQSKLLIHHIYNS